MLTVRSPSIGGRSKEVDAAAAGLPRAFRTQEFCTGAARLVAGFRTGAARLAWGFRTGAARLAWGLGDRVGGPQWQWALADTQVTHTERDRGWE